MTDHSGAMRGSRPPGPSRARQAWGNVGERLAASGTVQRARDYYANLSQRDQRALALLSVALMLLVVGLGIVWPLYQRAADARADYRQSLDDLAWIQANQHRINSAMTANRRPAGQSLLGLVTQSAAGQGLTVQRFNPMGADGLSINLDQVEFDRALAWLTDLIKAGVRIEEFNASRRGEQGMVDLRVVVRE